MGEPYALSRHADHGSHDMDSQGAILLSPLVFQIHVMHATLIQGPEKTILQDIQECLAAHKANKESVELSHALTTITVGHVGYICYRLLATK